MEKKQEWKQSIEDNVMWIPTWCIFAILVYLWFRETPQEAKERYERELETRRWNQEWDIAEWKRQVIQKRKDEEEYAKWKKNYIPLFKD